MSEDKPGHGDGPTRPTGPDGADSDGGLTDEQIDRETPGVDDASELEAAEAAVAEEAQDDEDKVVATPTSRRRRSSTRPATRDPERAGEGTRSRAAAERARAAELKEKRSLGRFLREVVAELRKVIWPGRRELLTYTTVVIIFVVIMVSLVAGLDVLLAQGVIAVFG